MTTNTPSAPVIDESEIPGVAGCFYCEASDDELRARLAEVSAAVKYVRQHISEWELEQLADQLHVVAGFANHHYGRFDDVTLDLCEAVTAVELVRNAVPNALQNIIAQFGGR